ncbi:MAG: 1-(5-phosphoribosyl)-5-[(5-phosphoribosylamino)methylideneamino]imidazole-4-carboxamide isomerase [Thermoplasmata archaeon]
MLVIPSIDLWDGRVGFLRGGGPEQLTTVSDDPVGTARSWQARGARRLQVVDLNAALGRSDNVALIQRLVGAVDLPIQVGGGLRETDQVDAVLRAGAARAIVSTRALRDPAWLAGLARRHPGRILLGIDHRARRALLAGRTESTGVAIAEILRAVDALPLAGVLFTNTTAEGQMRGVGDSLADVARLSRHERIAAGGVAGPEDLEELAEAGFDAAVVGLALYAEGSGPDRLREAVR